MAVSPTDLAFASAPESRGWVRTYIRRHPTIVIGGGLLALMVAMAIFAPYLGTADPQALAPAQRLHWPAAANWFGTDMLGRDVYSRTIYGARVSLTVGISVALLSIGFGMTIASTQRMKPATRPIVMPMPIARTATPIPTVNDTRAP